MMRIAYIFVVSLCMVIALSSLTEKNTDVSIKVEILDCRDNDDAYLGELTLLKDGKKIKKFTPEWDSEFTIDSLATGLYEFQYLSMFDLTVTIPVHASQPGKYPVKICTNYLDYSAETYKPVVDRLSEGESYSIYFSTSGCFHFDTDTLLISRNGGKYSAKHEGEIKQLDSASIESLRKFEWELNRVKTRGCTTSEDYTVVYKGRTVLKAEDGGCEWWGFRYLLIGLGFQKDQ